MTVVTWRTDHNEQPGGHIRLSGRGDGVVVTGGTRAMATAGGLAAAETGGSDHERRRTLRAVDMVPSLGGELVAVLVAREGILPVGAHEAVSGAGGRALVVGSGAQEAAESLAGQELWAADTGPGLRPGALATALAPLLRETSLIVLPASPDGRDLAPRLAAVLDRPLLAQANRVGLVGGVVRAELSRLDSRLLVDVEAPAPAVTTLVPDPRPFQRRFLDGSAQPQVLDLVLRDEQDVEVIELLEPDQTADWTRVLCGGVGLVPEGSSDAEATAVLALASAVASKLRARLAATRTVTDAGWAPPDQQIGPREEAPELYLALGVSRLAPGLGAPRHVISINTDATCPLTAGADLGLVVDAHALLTELAARLGVQR